MMWKAVGAIVGLALLVVGLLGAVGTVPGLELVSGANGAAFTVTGSNTLTLTVHDETSFSATEWSVGLAGIGWNTAIGASEPWTSMKAPGGTFTYTYSAPGNYTVTDYWELVCNTGQKCPSQYEYPIASASVPVPFNGQFHIQATANFAWKPVTGLEVSFTDQSNATGGAQITGISWAFGDGATATAKQGGTVTHIYSKGGTYSVTDTAAVVQGTASENVALTVKVSTLNTTALAATITGAATVRANGTDVFTVAAQGGTAPYSYDFVPSGYKGTANGATYTVQPAQAGTGTIYAIVTDAGGNAASTTTLSYTVTGTATNGTLQASITAGTTSLGIGTPATFTVAATGGSAPYTYSFVSTVSGSANGATYTITPSASGGGSIYAVVKDSAGATVSTNTVVFTVGPDQCLSGCSTGPAPTSGFVYNAVTGFLMLAGIGIMLAFMLPGNVEARILVAVILALLGFGTGFALGGPGPL
jgi:PKD repeat protein